MISSKDLPLIPLLSSNKSAKLVFINPTLLPNGKQGNARSHIRREDSGGENKRRTQRKEHRNVAYVTTVPLEPLCTYWPGLKCPLHDILFIYFFFMTFLKKRYFFYFIFQYRIHVRQEPDVLSITEAISAPAAWFLVSANHLHSLPRNLDLVHNSTTSKTKVTGHTPALTATWCLTPSGALLSGGLSANGLLFPSWVFLVPVFSVSDWFTETPQNTAASLLL